MQRFEKRPLLLNEFDNGLFTDANTIDSDALTKVDEMRRCIESHLVSGRLEYRSDTVRTRPFAVCACDMNGFEFLMRMSEMRI